MLKRLHLLYHVFGVYLALVILMTAFGADIFFTLPGKFLFERFHLASLYVPGLIVLGAIILHRGHVSRNKMIVLWLSPIVFITLALALQVSMGNENLLAPDALIRSLGRIPAASLLFLLFAAELAAFIRMAAIDHQWLRTHAAGLKDAVITMFSPFGLDTAELTEEPLPDDSAESYSPMVLPDFPEKPEAIENQEGEDEGDTEGPVYPMPSLQQNQLDTVLSESMPPRFEMVLHAENEQNVSPDGESLPVATRPKGVKKYVVPVQNVLEHYPDADFSAIDEQTQRGAQILEQTLREFKIEAQVTGIRKGPVITMYELLPSHGVKISSIVNLQDNIALRMAASSIRMVAPIPGKHAIGIEVPNKTHSIVSFSSLVTSDEFQSRQAGIPVILGKDISGENQVIDLTRTPHLLIAGATGSGKSVCVNSLIASILYARSPQKVKMIMVDPKIVELKLYNDIPHLLTPVITEPKRAIQALQWCLYEMERRYSLLDSQGVRDMNSFNKKVKERQLATQKLPYIVVIVDEFADLMATSGKELEGIVARLAAMSRAVGIHLVLATQRPSVDVITGLIKANFPSRIAFMVAGKTDSRIIIDSMGAEKLLGRGDMLFTSAWNPFPSRMQGAFLAEEEVERMVEFVKTLGEPDYINEEMFFDDDEQQDFSLDSATAEDPMYEKALEIVISSGKASASYLQRCLKIGYNRAARLVEDMEQRGIVGPANGSKPRDIIHIPERFPSAS